MGNLFRDIWWTITKGYYVDVTDIHSDLWAEDIQVLP